MKNLTAVESIFSSALTKATPEELAAYLNQACGPDAELRRHVERLLQANSQAGGFLNGSAPVATMDEPPALDQPGTCIGPYKLLERIGEGGMGEVWVAEQHEQIRRRVALKVIKPGMDSRSVLARFEAERQALALMDHPNIAKVLDAGSTPDGRPYFVMELVKGTPITEFCDIRKLSARQRLELFVPVCQAIQHAHHKGVIHRDIKPSNVLVELYDDRPVPKVIDFGVAKAVGQRLTDKTLYTGYGTLIGTPTYMAPEQATFNALDVDTRADVYSLGVLLYELLAGSPPFEPERLKQTALEEVLRLVREQEPPRPSARLSTSQAKATIAAVRQSDPDKLARLMRGELDWVVMRALEKDRVRRYDTAGGLARDVERYLKGETVEACPPTVGYKLRKFARKHKVGLATAAAFAALLLLGTAVSAWQAVRATRAEAVALVNEQQANTNAVQAEEKEQEANQQRDEAQQQRNEAQQQRDEVRALNEQLQSTLYASDMNLAQHTWETGSIAHVRELLERHRPKVGETDRRRFEWYYLDRLCHAEILSIRGAGHVVFSPDGKRLASAVREPGTSPDVKVWDAQTGQLVRTIKGAGSPAFSPDGKRLATGDDKTVKIWDAQTGQELLSIKGAGGMPVFCPDGKRLATGDDKTVKIWDAQTGQELLSIKSAGGAAFSPDGRRLATRDDKTVKIWDAQTGQELFSVTGGGPDIVFSPDGKRLADARSFDGTVKVWDAQTGQLVRTIKDAGSAAFSPDGKRLAAYAYASGRTVKVWDAQTGQELLSLQGHNGQINSVAFSPDGKRLASAGWDRMVHVWDAQTGQELLTYKGHTGMIRRVVFSPDGTRLVSAAMDGTVKVWDATTSPEARTFGGPTGGVYSLVFSPDGKRLAGADANWENPTVKVWNAQTGRELFSVKGGTGHNDFSSPVFSPDGKRLACATKDHTVKVWDAQTGQELLALKGHTNRVLGVAFHADGKRLASASADNTVKVWDAQTGQELFSFKIGPHSGATFSPDGKRLASASGRWQGRIRGWDGTPGDVKVWDTQTGQKLLSLKGFAGPYPTLAFSPDGKRLASSHRLTNSPGPAVPGEIKVWDAQTGQELLTLKGHIAEIQSIAFSPDGKRLASSARWTNTVQVWDAQTGQELLNLKLKIGEINSLAFSPNGHWLASDPGGTVAIWDATPLPVK
jgi:WD40 repeat protein/serine/threonine protein kinase